MSSHFSRRTVQCRPLTKTDTAAVFKLTIRVSDDVVCLSQSFLDNCMKSVCATDRHVCQNRNVIDNALTYGETAQLALFDDDQAVTIQVMDEGPGIAEDEMGRVFDPFVRLETSRSRDTGGTGLGLSVSKQLIELHGGTLTLDSTPGVGTTVTVAFPPARTVAAGSAASA